MGAATAVSVAPDSRPPSPDPDVSVLVPAKDEAGNLALFMELAEASFREHPGVSFEVVVVDDGSEDDTWATLVGLAERGLGDLAQVVVYPVL